MHRISSTLFQSKCLPEWNVSSQIFADGSGQSMEINNNQGNLLRFIYSSRHQTVYLQLIGYSDNIMLNLKKITEWNSIFWSVEAHNKNKHDCVGCEFNARNMHLLLESLNLIETERPLDKIRNQIYSFLSACNLEMPTPPQGIVPEPSAPPAHSLPSEYFMPPTYK